MLTVKGLVKVYKSDVGDVQAVKGISFEVAEGEVVTLLGPSGCGKTTTLRAIAGFEIPDSGEILIDGTSVYSPDGANVPTYRRPIAMVFQSYAIWPHMSVFDNVAYPLRVGKSKLNKTQVQERVMEALRMVQIPELAHRGATLLSGGQQQRVALARALVRSPKLLLLDEPLSNLDAKLREEMRLELKELFRRTGISAVYVTHDLLEALVLSHRIVVMNAGTVAQSGTPREVYNQPRNKFVADFMGAGNMLEGIVVDVLGDTAKVNTGFAEIVGRAYGTISEGDKVLVALRPDGLDLSRTRTVGGGAVSLPCVVETNAFLGNMIEYCVLVGDFRLRVRATATGEEFEPGAELHLRIDPGQCVVVATEREASDTNFALERHG